MRPSSLVASIVRVLTRACILLTISLIDLSSTIKTLLDSDASLNLIHEGLVRALGLIIHPCTPMLVTIANGTKLHHANRVVILKFTLAGVEHQETFLVAPLGNNQMILGMPWLERVNPLIDWKLRTLIYRTLIPRIFNRPHIPNTPPQHDADPASPCPPSIEPSYPSSDDAHRPQPMPVEHEPCSKSIIQEPIPQSTPQPCPASTNHAPRASSKNPFPNSHHNRCPSKTNHAPRAAPNLLPHPHHPNLNHAGRKSACQHPA